MNDIVLQDPLFLVVLGFGLAMGVMVVVLVLNRAGQSASPGYSPPPAAYSAGNAGDRLAVGCLFFPLLIASLAVLMALVS